MAFMLRLIGCGVLVAFAGGCLYFTGSSIEEGRPIPAANVNQITIGKTTRAEVYKLFGPPHSQFQGQVELKEGWGTGFFSHTQNRYLSTLDEQHYALLYRFVTSQGRLTGGTAIVVTVADVQGSIHSDELLLLLDMTTWTVVDVAYRR